MTYEPAFDPSGFGLGSQDGTSNPVPYGGSAPPPGVSPEQARQMVLNRIASGEANSYREIYGGHTFSSFADHPRIPVQITSGPNAGKYSTAAGRYQFLGSTWDAQAKKLGLTDFSPDSQDAAAWDLANTTYRRETGRSLLADAQNGNVSWGSLGSQWESLVGAKAGPGSSRVASGGRDWSAPGPMDGVSPLPASSTVAPIAGQDPATQMAALRELVGQYFPKPASQPRTVYDPALYAPGGLRGPTQV